MAIAEAAERTRPAPTASKPFRVERSRLHAQWSGRYLVHPRSGLPTVRPKPNWCRMQRATAEALAFVGFSGGNRGDVVSVSIKHLGVLHGRITRTIGALIMMDIDIDEARRQKLDARIGWLDRRHRLHLPEHRRSNRFEPKNPESRLLLPDGSGEECYILDLSMGGAFVTSAIRPRIGDTLALGRIVGKVLRHSEEGFAMQFHSPQAPDEVEHLAGWSTVELL